MFFRFMNHDGPSHRTSDFNPAWCEPAPDTQDED